MKMTLRRTLSLMLTVVMLVSCWVFVAPTEANASSGGTYYVRFTCDVNDTRSGNNNWVTFYYKEQDGTTGEKKEYCAEDGGTETHDVQLSGAPYKIAIHIYGNAGGGVQWYLRTITVSPNSNYTTNAKTIFSGEFGCAISYYRGEHQEAVITLPKTINTAMNARKGGFGIQIGSDFRQTINNTYNSVSGQAPALNSVAFTTTTSSVSVKTDNTSATQNFTARAYDQYGVQWYQDPTVSQTTMQNGCSFTSGTPTGTLTVPASSNRSSDYTVTIGASKTVGNTTKTASKTITINTFDYIVKFYDTNFDGTTGSLLQTQSSIDYNGSATPPSAPDPKYTSSQHKTFKSWSGTYTSLTNGAQTKTVTATYNTAASHGSWTNYTDKNNGTHQKKCGVCDYTTTEAHSGWTYSDFGSDDYHKKTCGYCTYNETNTSQHSYGATEFIFAENGQSATARKTCQTAGCGHKYDKAASISSSVTKDPTCTEMGQTTYIATSTFDGESDVKSDPVVKTDVAALGHDWNTPTFSFAADGKTATASRTCKREGCSYHSTAQTAAATISSAVKTDSTCTVKGWTTYTATSPWGDGTTDKKDVQDIVVKGHIYAPTTITFAADGKSATAERVCTRTGCTDAQEGHTQTTTLTLGDGITSEIIAPATCTETGTTRYTATSPYNDGVTSTKDVVDVTPIGHDIEDVDWTYDSTHHWKICTHNCGIEQLPSPHGDWVYSDDTNDVTHIKSCKTAYDGELCGYSEREGHDYGDTTITFAGNGQTATASRICADCNHIQTETLTLANGYITTSVQTQPTCTTMGTTLYTATSPFANDDTEFGEDNPNTLPVQDIEKLPHSYGEWVVITEPTCTNEGLKRRTCTTCNNGNPAFEEASIDAMGHHMEKVEMEPSDNKYTTPGLVYFHCTKNCGTYMGATYDPTVEVIDEETGEVIKTGDYVADESKTYTGAGAEAAAKNEGAIQISSPKFNNYEDEDLEYYYDDRGASLRLGDPTFTDRNTKQAMRFAASLQVPEGVSYYCGAEGEKVITDFGYVYTQLGELPNQRASELYIGAPMCFKMSVKDNNTTKLVQQGKPSKGPFDGSNWTGVSVHSHVQNGKTYDVLTFNIIINIKAYNWCEPYCARAFITYKYNGFEYTIYDSEMSESSVEYVAGEVVKDEYASEKAINYCNEKILAHVPVE